jgi:hypothetical protein
VQSSLFDTNTGCERNTGSAGVYRSLYEQQPTPDHDHARPHTTDVRVVAGLLLSPGAAASRVALYELVVAGAALKELTAFGASF